MKNEPEKKNEVVEVEQLFEEKDKETVTTKKKGFSLFGAFKNFRVVTVNSFSTILRVKDYPWDERDKIVSFFIISYVISFVALSAVGFLVIGFTVDGWKEFLPFAIQAGICLMISVGVIISTIVFLIFRKLLFSVIIVLLSCVGAMATFHYYITTSRNGGILAGSPIGASIFVVAVSQMFGNRYSNLFFLFLVVCNLFGSFIADYFCIPRIFDFFDYSKELYYNGNTSRMGVNIFYVYFPHFINLLIFSLVVFIQRNQITKSNQVIDSLGESILTLNFDKKEMKELEAKNPHNISKNELLFQGIIKNLKSYRRFLPSYILNLSDEDQNEETSSKKSNHSSASIKSDDLENAKSLEQNNGGIKAYRSKTSLDSEEKRTNSKNERNVERKFMFGLKPKNVVVMEINSNIFEYYSTLIKDETNLTRMKFTETELLEKLMIKFNDIVCSIVYECRGSIYAINPNSIIVTFNAKRIVVEPSQRAVKCALLIDQKFKRLKFHVVPRFAILKINNLLNGLIKYRYSNNFQLVHPKLSILSRIINYSHKSLFKKENNIFIDSNIKEDLKFTHSTKQVSLEEFQNFDGSFTKADIFRVYQKEGSKIAVEKEWFYEVKENVETSSLSKEEKQIDSFNAIWRAIKEDQFEDAKKLIGQYELIYDSTESDLHYLKQRIFEFENLNSSRNILY